MLKIILSLFNKLFKKLTQNKAINGLNRLFGFIIGAVKGALVVAGILLVASLFSSAKFMAPFNEALDQTKIAKPVNSVVYDYVGKNINLDDILDNLLKKNAEAGTPDASGGGEEEPEGGGEESGEIIE